MTPNQIEVDGETVDVVEVTPLEQYRVDDSTKRTWRNQAVVNVITARRKGQTVLVFEYGPGFYQFQRRYSLRGDERAGRAPDDRDNSL